MFPHIRVYPALIPSPSRVSGHLASWLHYKCISYTVSIKHSVSVRTNSGIC